MGVEWVWDAGYMHSLHDVGQEGPHGHRSLDLQGLPHSDGSHS